MRFDRPTAQTWRQVTVFYSNI